MQNLKYVSTNIFSYTFYQTPLSAFQNQSILLIPLTTTYFHYVLTKIQIELDLVTNTKCSHDQDNQPQQQNLLGNSIGIQKTSSQGSNSSKRSNVEQEARNGRIASGPHSHPRVSDFLFLDLGSFCSCWRWMRRTLNSSSNNSRSSYDSKTMKLLSPLHARREFVWGCFVLLCASC